MAVHGVTKCQTWLSDSTDLNWNRDANTQRLPSVTFPHWPSPAKATRHHALKGIGGSWDDHSQDLRVAAPCPISQVWSQLTCSGSDARCHHLLSPGSHRASLPARPVKSRMCPSVGLHIHSPWAAQPWVPRTTLSSPGTADLGGTLPSSFASGSPSQEGQRVPKDKMQMVGALGFILLFSLRIVPFWSFSFGFVLLLLFVCFLFLVFVCLFWGVFFCFCFVLAGRGGKYCFGSKRHCLCTARSLSGLKYYVFSGTSPEISWNCQLSYHQKICINNPRRFFLELFFFS